MYPEDSRRVQSRELILPVHGENRMYPSSESTALGSVGTPGVQGTARVRPSSLSLFQCQEHLSLAGSMCRCVHKLEGWLGEEGLLTTPGTCFA